MGSEFFNFLFDCSRTISTVLLIHCVLRVGWWRKSGGRLAAFYYSVIALFVAICSVSLAVKFERLSSFDHAMLSYASIIVSVVFVFRLFYLRKWVRATVCGLCYELECQEAEARKDEPVEVGTSYDVVKGQMVLTLEVRDYATGEEIKRVEYTWSDSALIKRQFLSMSVVRESIR